MRGLARVLLVALVVVSVAPPVAPVNPVGTAAAQETRADPANDTVGWEDGYWHDDPINVDQSDGLSDAELNRYVARAKARVEYIRQTEFEADVPVSVIDRETYRNRTSGGGNTSDAYAAWNNQVWEALFIVGEDTDVQDELGSTYGSSVAGFYSPRDDEIKIITDDPDAPTIDNATLIHELTHALQDQRFNLSHSRYGGETQDAQLASDGVVEGEANYIEARYRQRCGSGEWECVSTPPRSGGGSSGDGPNLGILLTILQPYSDGPVYIAEQYDEGGWAAVDEAMRNPPTTTEQTIHVTDEEPSPVRFTDRAENGWRTFPNQGVDGADVAGEASMFVMFWDQARTADARTVDPSVIGRTDGQFDQYNYDAPPSDGWDGDRIVPYRKDGEYGYVWVTQWDTEQDAREFREAYFAILRAHDARTTEEGIRVVDDGPYADAFLVSQDGTRIVVVNGPTPDDVRDIRPGLDAAESDGGGISGVTAPGFGVGAALVALATLASALLVGRRLGRR